MNFLLRGLGNGFGRTLGRIFAYIFIGFLIFILVKSLGIDLSSFIPKISIGGIYEK